MLAAGLGLGQLFGLVHVELERLRVLIDGNNPAVIALRDRHDFPRSVFHGLSDKAVTGQEHGDVIAGQVLGVGTELGPGRNVIDRAGNGDGGTLARNLRGTQIGKGLVTPADSAGGRGRGYQP